MSWDFNYLQPESSWHRIFMIFPAFFCKSSLCWFFFPHVFSLFLRAQKSVISAAPLILYGISSETNKKDWFGFICASSNILEEKIRLMLMGPIRSFGPISWGQKDERHVAEIMGVASSRRRTGTSSSRRYTDREEIPDILNIEILFTIISLVLSAWVSCPYTAV